MSQDGKFTCLWLVLFGTAEISVKWCSEDVPSTVTVTCVRTHTQMLYIFQRSITTHNSRILDQLALVSLQVKSVCQLHLYLSGC
jgi:hypothetical protein